MSITSIIAEIDAEIAHLQKARGLLSSIGSTTKAKAPAPAKKRRKLSAKARKAIADAQKARWAKVRANKK